MRTYIKAYMSLNFGQIPSLTTELAALERLKNRCHHVISVDIDPIFFKLAGNKDMHNIMNEFEFRPDQTTDYGVSCPWASKKYTYRPYNGENGVSTFSLLFLIGSFWYFHVTRTSIKVWMSLNFLKWDLTLAHWTQVSDRCPLGYLFHNLLVLVIKQTAVPKLKYFLFTLTRLTYWKWPTPKNIFMIWKWKILISFPKNWYFAIRRVFYTVLLFLMYFICKILNKNYFEAF